MTTRPLSNDAEKIADPGSWPYWPMLPMKRRRADNLGMETGWISADFPHIIMEHTLTTKGVLMQLWVESTPEALEELGVFKPPPVPDEIAQMYRDGIKHRYESVEAMLADGWVVD